MPVVPSCASGHSTERSKRCTIFLFVILIMRLEDAKPVRANSRGVLNPWKN